MRDVELYRHLLGLESPWTVARVELDVKAQQVDVWAEHGDAKWPCPECGKELAAYDHALRGVGGSWTAASSKTVLHARILRVDCGEHGVRQVRVPWAEPKSRFTALFERFAIDVLKETDITGATRILRISWDEAFKLIERAVAPGQMRKGVRSVKRIGVDEKVRGEGAQVPDARLRSPMPAPSNTSPMVELGRAWTATSPLLQRTKGPASRRFRRTCGSPSSSRCSPTFRELSGSSSSTSSTSWRTWVRPLTSSAGASIASSGQSENLPLTGSKYLWLRRAETIPEARRDEFDQLRALNLKTARAWAMKEHLRDMWSYRSKAWARSYFERWYGWAARSRLKPVFAVAKMIKRHATNVFTYFRHRITNAVAEGLNSKIQTIKKRAYGFRNPENFKLAIYFHCGGLDLYPSTHVKA